MSPVLPLTSLVSTYAGAKARQLRRDAILFGFVCLMAVMATGALFSAFAVAMAETYGLANGLLAAAGLALALALVALAVRSLLRYRARRRMGSAMAKQSLDARSLVGFRIDCTQQVDSDYRRSGSRRTRRHHDALEQRLSPRRCFIDQI